MEWNYEPRALSLRDDLVDEFSTMFDQFNIELIESSGGVFEVMVNDVLEVFSKRRIGRHINSSYEIIKTINDAIDETLDAYGNGSTNYGQALLDFKEHCLADVDKKTTIIILGDARNNYGEPETEVLRELYQRSNQLIWLNPEHKNRWGSGDSEMKKYQAYCTLAEVCNSLSHLERAIDKLLIRQ